MLHRYIAYTARTSQKHRGFPRLVEFPTRRMPRARSSIPGTAGGIPGAPPSRIERVEIVPVSPGEFLTRRNPRRHGCPSMVYSFVGLHVRLLASTALRGNTPYDQ